MYVEKDRNLISADRLFFCAKPDFGPRSLTCRLQISKCRLPPKELTVLIQVRVYVAYIAPWLAVSNSHPLSSEGRRYHVR